MQMYHNDSHTANFHIYETYNDILRDKKYNDYSHNFHETHHDNFSAYFHN